MLAPTEELSVKDPRRLKDSIAVQKPAVKDGHHRLLFRQKAPVKKYDHSKWTRAISAPEESPRPWPAFPGIRPREWNRQQGRRPRETRLAAPCRWLNGS